MSRSRPEIVSRDADLRFWALAIKRGMNPDDRWVGGSVEHAWERSRHVFEQLGVPLAGASVLEFGCNVGGTAIVLAALGATVTAVDVDPGFVELAATNAERYAVKHIQFHCVPDSTRLPFRDGEFDLIVCNSVLEYVAHPILGGVQREIDRTLRRGGVILVAGTSNRLWPREIHSGQWLTNYLPRGLDGVLFGARPPERGIWPWEVQRGFGRYENVDLAGRGRGYLAARRARGMAGPRYQILRLAIPTLRVFGLWAGLLTPSMSVTLRKR
ncbi:MAG TPA: class I SAM-dependent methyltransferase [Methylomirabilota bacterium]|nr:class I SAM-dependent methyltransferase [Methylomirabilota bacterium]